jgi:hypothetical protein
VRVLFEEPTVAGLAEAIEQRHVLAEDNDDLARLLEEVEELPEDEVQRRLNEKIDFSQG